MRLSRWVIESSTGLIGRMKRGRRVKIASDKVLVNLGCGLAIAPGWINVDGSINALVAGWYKPLLRVLYRLSGAHRYYSEQVYLGLLTDNRFIHHDLSHGVPFEDDSVDQFFSSHFLEHLTRRDGERLLRDAYRALRPGGMVRIAVPDLAYAVSLYAAGKTQTMLQDYFFVEDDDSSLARHKTMYDFALLKTLLQNIGFEHIVRRSYREGEAADIMLLDNRPEDSLFVEAKKPAAQKV